MKLYLPHISLDITSECNLNCKYCYNIWKIDNKNFEHLNSYKKAVKVLKRIFKMAEVDNVTFTGGEPFLSERFLETVLFTRMKGKNVTLISNGTAGTKDEYKMLIDMGVNVFEFPLHSPNSNIHDLMTGVKGSWEKSRQSIIDINSLGGYAVAVIVITKHNYEHIEDTLKFIKELGISRIMVNRYNIGGVNAKHPENVLVPNQELKKTYSAINRCVRKYNLTVTSNVCTPACLLEPSNYPNIGFGFCSSNVIQRPLTVDLNGNLRLCNHSPIVAGNIFEDDIEKILFSDYSESWSTIKPEFCNNCNKWEKCMGGCRAASEQLGLGLKCADPVLGCT